MLLTKEIYSTTIVVLGKGLVVAAFLYLIFAFVWGDTQWLIIEALGILLYVPFYYLAVKYSPYFLVVGWLLHSMWDIALHYNGPGYHIAPKWYAIACISFDVLVAIYLFIKLNNNYKKLVQVSWLFLPAFTQAVSESNIAN